MVRVEALSDTFEPLVKDCNLDGLYTVSPTGCWNWKFMLNGNSDRLTNNLYAALNVYKHNQDGSSFKSTIRVARWVVAKLNNLDYSDKSWEVLHSCHNPSCINPDHVASGSRVANNRNRSNSLGDNCPEHNVPYRVYARNYGNGIWADKQCPECNKIRSAHWRAKQESLD